MIESKKSINAKQHYVLKKNCMPVRNNEESSEPQLRPCNVTGHTHHHWMHAWPRARALYISLLSSFAELGLEELDGVGVHLEALGQDGVGDLGLGAEQGLRGEHDAGQLAVEDGHGARGAGADVVLEVHHPARDDEALPGADHLGVELPFRADEADQHLAGLHVHQLGRPRVRVQRVHAAGGQVDAVDGQAQRVEPRERLHVARSHGRAVRAVRAPGARVPREEEVVGDHRRRRLAREARVGGGVGRVVAVAACRSRGHAEVLHRVRVGAAGGGEEQRRRQQQEEQQQRRRRGWLRHGSGSTGVPCSCSCSAGEW